MALDSSFTRGDATGAYQNSEDTDEVTASRLPGHRPTGSGISVTLWDEIVPASSHTTPPLDDDAPEA
ncbi:hypothetical protein AWB77_04209 [Caballeronia fortuita]|uniref:Uncharacterized protein n=1 Tax=Caballeronia fortuita TaxID=1777138 RepID=A0A158CKU9_9BURK|nr:hypothetical protein [Caballeronia fortuita]SAK82496.1 hypothetical protein AWB77_04209 [Caballeronia fortuita]